MRAGSLYYYALVKRLAALALAVACLTGIASAQTLTARIFTGGVNLAGVGPVNASSMLGEPKTNGFTVKREDIAVSDALAAFDENARKGTWDKAFAALATVTESNSTTLARSGDGFYLPARQRSRQLLLALPTEGRHAYRVFNDATARQALAQLESPLENEPPVNELDRLQELYDRYFITSSGDRIADRLGDAKFESGDFSAAADCWGAILSDFPDTSLSLARISAKRALALARAHRWDELARLETQIRSRFGDQSIRIGGGDITTTALLASLPEPQGDAEKTAVADASPSLPTDSDPLWQSIFADDNVLSVIRTYSSNSSYGYNPLAVPPGSAADEQRIYLHWFGVGIAIDAQTGKIVWRTDSTPAMLSKIQQTLVGAYDSGESSVTVAPGLGRVLLVNGSAVTRQIQLQAAAIGGAVAPAVVVRGGRRGPGPATAPAAPAAQNAAVQAQAQALAQAQARAQALAAARIVLRPGTGVLTCLKSSDGAKLWSSDTTTLVNWNVQGEPVVKEGVAYIAALPVSGTTSELNLLDIAVADGAIRHKLPLGLLMMATNHRGLMVGPKPLLRIWGDRIYVLTGNGALVAVNLTDFQIDWIFTYPTPLPLERMAYPFGGAPDMHQFPAAMCMDGSILYFKERASNLMYALDVSGPTVKWQRRIDSEATILGSDDSSIYLLSDEVNQIDLRSLEMRWSTDVAVNTGWIQPLVSGSHALLFGANGLYDVDLRTGARNFSRGYDMSGTGGAIWRVGDRLVCVSGRAVTAYALPQKP